MSDRNRYWKPSEAELADLNKIRLRNGLAVKDIDEIRTVGDWMDACSETDIAAEESQ